VYLYMIHTYRQLFTYQRFGYGVALLWVLFVVVMALTVLVFRSASYWVYYEALAEEGRGR
jgi:ABC-type sugar transport system permease subunit